MKRAFLYLLPVLYMISSNGLFGQADKKYIRQGNKEYEEGVFDESEILYRKALEKQSESYTGEFNLGDALYKQEKFEDAIRSFNDLVETESDKDKLSKLYHNLGNSLLNSNRAEDAVEAYKQSLRNNPYDEETRHNLAFAQQLLQQQQEQQQQNGDQENQDQQDQENQDQENQDQENQDQENQDQENQDQENQDKQDQENQDQQDQQISKEDAERMLQALQQDEQELQEKLKEQQARANRVRVLKDW